MDIAAWMRHRIVLALSVTLGFSVTTVTLGADSIDQITVHHCRQKSRNVSKTMVATST
jgi:hypothetical protein